MEERLGADRERRRAVEAGASRFESGGYDGWFGVEDFSGTFDTRAMLRTYAEQMNRWMEEMQ